MGTSSQDLLPTTRTVITSKLWEARRAQDASLHNNERPVIDGVPSRTPSDSAVCIQLDLRDPTIRDQYRSFSGAARVGKLFEDLDALAANVAHAHATSDPSRAPLAIVTAAVDHVTLSGPITLSQELDLRGVVSYVGRSSMEVLCTVADCTSGEELMRASFVMVARDPSRGGPARLPALHTTTDTEKALFAAGEAAKEQRRLEARASLRLSPPTEGEVEIVHDLLYRQNKAGDEAATPDALPRQRVPMASTALGSVGLCQPQDRNTRDKVFGGFLMQRAYEVASCCAHVYCARAVPPPGSASPPGGQNDAISLYPQLLGVDDIAFLHPVEIGNVLRYNAEVVYSQGGDSPAFQIAVTADVISLCDAEPRTTNIFHYSFAALPPHVFAVEHGADIHVQHDRVHEEAWQLPGVRPHTYEEAMRYVDGRRRLHRSAAIASRQRSRLAPYFHDVGDRMCHVPPCPKPAGQL